MPKKKRMSWRQLYNSSTVTEQREMITIMFTAIENRQALQMRLIEIQHAQHQKDQRKKNVLRMLFLQLFLFVLLTAGITSALIVQNAPPTISAPIMAFNLMLFIGVMLVKPIQSTLAAIVRTLRNKKPPIEA